jgi:hypothetical protein
MPSETKPFAYGTTYNQPYDDTELRFSGTSRNPLGCKLAAILAFVERRERWGRFRGVEPAREEFDPKCGGAE